MPVLCYHAVDPAWSSVLAVTPAALASQCSWLRRDREVLPLARFVGLRNGVRPRRAVALTFDDGFASLYDHARGLLRDDRLPATVFLVARTLVTGPAEADWVPAPEAPRPTLDAEQVRELAETGVEFGSHSWAHRNLTLLTEEECVTDLRDSREALESILGSPVPFLAYPYGFHTPHVRRAARTAGYSHAFTLPRWGEARAEGPFAVPRVGVYRGNSLRTVRIKCTPAYLAARTNPLTGAVLRRKERG